VAKAPAPPPIADTQSIVEGKLIYRGIPLALLRDDPTDENLKSGREAAKTNPLIVGQTLSHDAHTTLVLVRLTRESYQDLAQVEQLRDFVERTARRIMEPVGVRVRITGTPAVRVEVFHAANRDLIRYGGIAAAVAIVLAMLLLRSIVMPLAAAAAAGLAILWTVGFAGLANIPANVMTIDLALALAMTTIAGGLFTQLAARQAQAAGGDVEAATARSVRATGIASFAIAAGSICWLGSDGIGVAGLGKLSAFGILAGFGAVALVIQPFAVLMSQQPTAARPIDVLVERTAGLIASPGQTWSGTVGVAAIVWSIVAVYGATQARPNLHLEDNLPTRGDYVDTMRHCGRVMGGVYHVTVVIRLPENVAFESPASEAVHRDLEALLLRTEPLTNPMSLVNVVEGLRGYRDGWNRAVATVAAPTSQSGKIFLNHQRHESLVTARIADVGTAEVEAVGLRIDAGLDELRKKHPGFEFELTGMPIVAARALDRSLRRLIEFTAVGLAAALVALSIGLGSLRSAAIVVAAAFFALAVTVCGMALPGMAINYGNVVVPQLVAALTLLCAVHFVSASGEPAGTAPSPALAVWCSTVVLLMFLAGSAVFLKSEISTRRDFGIACSIGLAAALLANGLIVPALMKLILRPAASSPV
jgi:predicted RND superfamily exporter protein